MGESQAFAAQKSETATRSRVRTSGENLALVICLVSRPARDEVCRLISRAQPSGEGIQNDSWRMTDDLQRGIAQLRLEGFSNQEIAQKLNISLRTVERKLGLIREAWENQISA